MKKKRKSRQTRRKVVYFFGLLVVFILFISILIFYKYKAVKGTQTSIFLTKNGTQLQLYGQPYNFTGVNVFNAATYGHVNAGCGSQISDADLDALFSNLRPNSIVRFWAWQGSMATNVTTKQLDWTGIDRVISHASLHGQRLIISLGDQAGTCDDALWKDVSWYNGGFTQVHNPTGMTPLSYWNFAQQIVARYKDSPTIAMWELINEPEASTCAPGYGSTNCYAHLSCPDEQAAANSLRYFFDTVGGKVKSIDPNHLIESGVIGNGQCGAIWTDYQYIHESSGIDVASYHDYTAPDSPMPGDQWNGLQERLDQMKAVQKPLIIGEVGMIAMNNSTNCMSLTSRRDKIKAKMDAQIPAGVAGYIPWNWTSTDSSICNYDFSPIDPLMSLLQTYPLLTVIAPPTPTGAITPTPTSVFAVTPTPTIDTILPSVSITKPLTGSTVPRNTTIVLSAQATDNDAISSVNFYINDSQQCSVKIAPYNCNWRVPARKNISSYTIRATATDLSGNTNSTVNTVTAK